MTDPTPRLLGDRYELGETIGVGGMAEVFRGLDVRLGRDVAVKVLRADLARDPSFQARFRREAQSAASLNAPCIVSVYDTGEEGDVPYIVMEHVEGRTLRDILQTEGRLLPQRALEVVADVCAALDVAHTAGIVHRDIKPANVMLTPRGEVKVMDFGIARAISDTSSTMTQTAAVIGTAAYLSPEQARGEHVDLRSDIYSTGCMLYELVTGTAPFTGDSPVAVAYQHVREDPVLPSAYDETLPQAVDSVVLKAMAKNPANRYQSADEMREDLLRAAAGQPVLATPFLAETETVVPVTDGLRTPRRRRRGPLLLLLGLLLLGITIGVALLVRGLLTNDAGLIAAPALVGKTQQEATLLLANDGLQVGEVTQRFAEQPAGTVLAQSPEAGFLIGKGDSVGLTVSKGIEMTIVPQVIGQSQGEAEAALQDAKLTIAKVLLRDGNLPEGQVLGITPAPGAQVRANSTVTVVVASGKVQVPDVRNKTQQEAIDALQKLGFAVGLEPRDEAGKPPGTVLDQRPVNQLAPRGSVVVIVIARKPAPSPSPSPSPSPVPFESLPPSTAPSPEPSPSPVPSPT
ncbi:MAG: Stk1 family PASTA domain-containing Ser/Thr kinase [Actinobacteria bacterium]|nr:Stk1 family PASTA domain-containing Ser/Thr kinase [Actinomycetota bacterium]MCA1722003.1 Stk1 family PASTA domain-containing Ser/Thr kinase [Actinomycetota bacterium]